MRNLYIFFLLSLFISGCSSDKDILVSDAEVTQLTAMRFTSAYGVNTTKYGYEGSFLKTVQLDDNPPIVYSYRNNLVVSAATEGVFETYEYDSQDRITARRWGNGMFREEYEYPGPQTILLKLYDDEHVIQKQTIHLENDEISYFENEILRDGVWVSSSFRFTYDTLNNPRAQWPGFDKLYFAQGLRFNAVGRYHNVLSCVETTPGVVNPNSAWYNITYNENDFPSYVEVVDQNGVGYGASNELFY